ncbi:MAG TPA: YbaB/EbfC family nucleoid-associated protein [Phycisphaerales bacterium]|nr:YbaB/EbfC family nucleoid-associated protein [Phycisphaerales bacterium]
MFDKLKAMGALAGLMKNREALRAAGDRVKEKMDRTRCSGEAGGGAVRAVVSGKMEVVEITITPALASGMAADPKTRELAGGLIAEAINVGLRQAQERLQEAVKTEAEALGLGDLGGAEGLAGLMR